MVAYLVASAIWHEDLSRQAIAIAALLATDFPYAHLRAATEFGAQILARYPAECELGFNGYCIGEPAQDWRFEAPDPIWFVHAGNPGGAIRGFAKGPSTPGSFPIRSAARSSTRIA